MTKPADDLEAVRIVAETLESFDSKDRQRIIRWALEKLGTPLDVTPTAAPQRSPSGQPAPGPPSSGPRDIRSFIQEKNPRNERHLAAVVAYYFHFEAPPEQQQESIGSQDLVEACRTANWTRPRNPSQTMVNAFNSGYLDKTGERGRYRLNAVGENLVAMVLPEADSRATPAPKPAPRKKAVRKKKVTRNKASKKKKASRKKPRGSRR